MSKLKKSGLNTSPVLRSGAAACMLLGYGVLATPGLAQQAGEGETQASTDSSASGITDIVVTARRVSENIQRVPLAVTAVTGATLEQKSILKIEDLARTVPGFTAQAAFQSGAPVYTIRGQHGDTNATPNTEPAVQVYFAELNQARAIGTTGSFFDIASVQVLKGPQGTLFGRNSTGGAVLITPKAPEHALGGYAQGSLGDFAYRDLEAVLNIPLGEAIALRVGGKMTDRDGYIKNIVTGADGGGLDNRSARASLLIEPGTSIKSTFIATYAQTKLDGPTVKLDSTAPFYFQTQFAAFGPGAAALAAAYQADAAAQKALGPYRTRAFNNPFSHDKVYSIQNNTEWKLTDDLTLKNVIGYRNSKQDQSSDFSGGSLDYFANGVQSESDLYSEELQLQGKVENLEFVIGAYLLREEVSVDAQPRIFGSLAQVLGNPALNFVFPSRNAIFDDFTTNSQSVFAHANYDLSSIAEGVSISGGVRMTRDRKKAVFRIFSNNGSPAGITGFKCTVNGRVFTFPDTANCATTQRLRSTEPTYDISLNYQATSDVLLYLAHRHGYRAGGFDLNPPIINQASYAPEFVDDVEFGLKSKFDVGTMPVRLNAATYVQKYKDIQRLTATRNADGTGVVNRTLNTAAAEIYGGEIELTVKPSSSLELSGTYAYTNADNTDFSVLYNGAQLDVSDAPFSYVAKHQWSLSGRYSLPVPAELGDISISATWYGQSSMAAADIATSNCGPDGKYLNCLNAGSKVPAYDLVNLRIAWNNVADKGFDLALFVNNVADTVYKSTVLGLNGPLGITSVGYGPPRMFGATLKIPLGSEAD